MTRGLFFAAVAAAVVGLAFVEGGAACSSPSAADAGSDARGDASPPDVAAEDGRVRDVAKETRADGGVPVLVDLSVTSSSPTDASPPLVLVPAFSPSVHDYYVRCAAGANALTVSMTASHGAESLLIRPVVSGSLPAQTLSVSVNENDAVVAVATNGTATAEYWVRCLPHDFPHLEMTVHPDAGPLAPGYYLLGNDQSVGRPGYAMVLDSRGVPVWYHQDPKYGVVDVDSVVPGAISFIPNSLPLPTQFEIHHLAPLATSYLAPGGGRNLNQHELRLLSNGHYLVFSFPILTGVDLTGLNLPLPDGGARPLGPNSDIYDCDIVEIDATGAVFWTWTGTKHFDPVMDSRWPQPAVGGVTGPDGGTVYDVFHCNSIDVDPANGNLLVSARHMDSLFYIDRATSAVLWKMGGAAYSKDGATYVPVDVPFYRQHDARLQPGWSPCGGGSGQISLFDDQTSRPGVARAVVYDVHVGAGGGGCDGGAPDGGAEAGAKVAWELAGGTSSAAQGSFRITKDGARVVGWGYGPPKLVFTEVDVQKHDLADFYFTDGDTSYRVIKVPPSAFELDALRNATSLP